MNERQPYLSLNWHLAGQPECQERDYEEHQKLLARRNKNDFLGMLLQKKENKAEYY